MNKFLCRFSLEDLKQVLAQTNSAVQLIKSKPRQLQEVMKILDGFEASSETIPRYSDQLLRGIGDYWNALITLDNDPQIHSVWLNITHQRVMMSKTWVIQYLYEDCKTQVRKLSAHHRHHIFSADGNMSCDCMQHWESLHGDTSSWLARLCLDLSHKLTVGGHNHIWEVSSASYLPVLDPPMRVSYQLTTWKARIPSDDERFDSDIAWNVITLITSWLKFPSNAMKGLIRQAGFVSSISQVLGKESLLLPAVWDLYKADPKWITQRYKISQPSLMGGDAFYEFKCALRTCSAAKPDSTERHMLLQIQSVHEEFMKISKTTVSQASRSQVAQIMAPSEQQPMTIYSGNAVNFLLVILRDALDSLGPTAAQRSEKQFQLIAEDSDNFLALREHGASRRRILSCPNNPFEDRNIVTNAGLFSAFYFRARSFRSPALLHTPDQHLRTFFSGPQDVRNYESDIQNLLDQSPELFGTLTDTQRKHFFHHHRMYGQSNPLPDDWAESLWKAVELTNWEALMSGSSADFQSLHKLWTKPASRSKKNEAEVPSQFLPKMGALALYLLCADLSYTCAVPKPTIGCLGEMISSLKSGAVNGLQILGILSPDLTGKELRNTVKPQFAQVFEAISEQLSEEEKSRMGFDGVVLEHTLCKVGRFLGAKAYQEWGFKKLMKRKAAEIQEDGEEGDDEDNDAESSSRKKKKKTASRKGKEKAME